MATATLDLIYFPQPVSVNQTITVYYKLSTDSIANYSLVALGVVVGTDGIPLSPPSVNGLIEGLSYDFLIYNTTCSPSKDWIQTITVPAS